MAYNPTLIPLELAGRVAGGARDFSPDEAARLATNWWSGQMAERGAAFDPNAAARDLAALSGGYTIGGQPVTAASLLGGFGTSDVTGAIAADPDFGPAAAAWARAMPARTAPPPPATTGGGEAGPEPTPPGLATTKPPGFWGGAPAAGQPYGPTSGGLSPQQLAVLSDMTRYFEEGSLFGADQEEWGTGLPGIISRTGRQVGSAELTPLQASYVKGMGGERPGEEIDVNDLPGVKEVRAYADQAFQDYVNRMTQEAGSRGTGLDSIIAKKAADLALQTALFGAQQRQRGLQVGLTEADRAIARELGFGQMAASGLQAERGNVLNLGQMTMRPLESSLGRMYGDYQASLARRQRMNEIAAANRQNIILGALKAGTYLLSDPSFPAWLKPLLPSNTASVTIGSNGGITSTDRAGGATTLAAPGGFFGGSGGAGINLPFGGVEALPFPDMYAQDFMPDFVF